jgi:type III secretion protein W
MGFSVPTGGMENRILETMKTLQLEEADLQDIKQDVSKEMAQDKLQESVNPLLKEMKKGKKSLSENRTRVQKALSTKESTQDLDAAKDSAQKFEKRNPELKAKMLILLREQIKDSDSKEEILEKVKNFYDDVALRDEAFEFLEENSKGELREKIGAVKKEQLAENRREIIAGRNISQQAREFSEKGLGSPTALRDMYYDITGNPRDSKTLFKELSTRFQYQELKKVLKFLFHSLGADLKAKGSSIEPGLLSRLMSETRSLQAILGVYSHFKKRMDLVRKLFKKAGMAVPSTLTFESMAKAFMNLVSERFISPDKILRESERLGLEKWILAKIIVLSQMRDGVREMSMEKIFTSLQHRDDFLAALIEALEELEDELDEQIAASLEGKEDEDDDWEDDSPQKK